MKVRDFREKQSHKSISKSLVVKTKNPKPRGILYNYVSQKKLPSATENKKPGDIGDIDNLRDNEYDQDLDEDIPTFGSNTADLLKLHKMVWVDGKCLLLEHKNCSTENKNSKKSINGQDSDTENKRSSSVKHCNDDSDFDSTIPPTTIIANLGDNEQDQGYYRLIPSKNYIQKLSYSNDKVVQGLINVNSVDLYDNKMYATKEDLADARKGKAMMLIPITKYNSLNDTITMMHSKEARKNLDAKPKPKPVSKRHMAIQTEKLDDNDLKEMKTLQTRLSEIFTEAQISVIKDPKHTRNIEWSEEEMANVVHLRQMITQPAYIFLKYKMHFPLPSLPFLRKWMQRKNIPLVPVKEVAIQYKAQHTQTENSVEGDRENVPLFQSQGMDPEEEPQRELRNSDKTSDANEDDDEINTTYLEVDHMNDNDLSYLRDDNDTSDDETLPLNYKDFVSPRPKCQLCMRPFDSESEFREHVADHYKETSCTSYLDATKPYKCEFCSGAVKVKSHLVHHHRVHLGINLLQCWHKGCKFLARSMELLKKHERSHSRSSQLYYGQNAPSISCPFPDCTVMFSSQASLNRHKLERHSAQSPYKCHLCPHAAYECQSDLEIHLRGDHKACPINCDVCPAQFYDYDAYCRHKAEKHDFMCERCGQRFDFKYKLGQHKLKCTTKPQNSDNESNDKRKELKRKLDNDENASQESVNEAKRRKPVEKDVPEQKTMPEVSHNDSTIQENQNLDSHPKIVKVDSKSLLQNVIVSEIRRKDNPPRVINKKQKSVQNKVLAVSGKQTHNIILGHVNVNQQQKSMSLPKIHQETILVPAKRQEKNITIQESPRQKADALNQRQVAFTVTSKPQQKVKRVPESQSLQQKVYTMAKNEQLPIYVIPSSNKGKVANQQKVYTKPESPEKVRTVPGIHTNSVFIVQGNNEQKVIRLSENVSPKNVTKLTNKQSLRKQQQKRISTSVNRQQMPVTVTGIQMPHFITNSRPQNAESITLHAGSSIQKGPVQYEVIRTIAPKKTQLQNVISLSQPVTQTSRPNEIIKTEAFGNTIQEQIASLLGGSYPSNFVILETDNANQNTNVPSYTIQEVIDSEGVDTTQERVDINQEAEDTTQEGVDTIQGLDAINGEFYTIQAADTTQEEVDTTQQEVDTTQQEVDTVEAGVGTIQEGNDTIQEEYATLEGQDIVSYQQGEDTMQIESTTEQAQYIIHQVEDANQKAESQQYIINEEGKIQVKDTFKGEYILHEVAGTIQDGDSFKEEQYILLEGTGEIQEGESYKENEYVIHTLEGDNTHVYEGEEIVTELEQFEVAMEEDTSGLFD